MRICVVSCVLLSRAWAFSGLNDMTMTLSSGQADCSLPSATLNASQEAGLGWPKNMYEQILDGTAFNGMTSAVLVSGGAPGADFAWGQTIKKFLGSKADNVLHLRSQSNLGGLPVDDKTVFDIPEKTVQDEGFKKVFKAVRDMEPEDSQKDLDETPQRFLRQYLISKRVDAMYVVSFIDNKSPRHLNVGGGAGYAVAMYNQRFKVKDSIGEEDPKNLRVYVFDDCSKKDPTGGCYDEATHHKWSKWNVEKQALEIVDPADIYVPKGPFAGIGHQGISNTGTKAIDDLVFLFASASQGDKGGAEGEESSALLLGVHAPGLVLLISLLSA